MPNLTNAKKALKQSKKKAITNLAVKNTYKKAVKVARKAVDTDEKDLGETLRLAQKKLDKAAKKGVIKKNTAARKLSRLMKKVNLSGAASAKKKIVAKK
ncbi:MAG: 30S ribosomal protein S20 [Candidatus Magasanikbacteria bacterium]|nr:30S ribosomal protein S20 [Candidatus Magasanikbacteria bacterium]